MLPKFQLLFRKPNNPPVSPLQEKKREMEMIGIKGGVQVASIPSAKQKNTHSLEKLMDEGRAEAEKERIKHEETQKQKLDELLQHNERALYRLSTVFPFDLFPDDVVIDLHKVNLISRTFFFSEGVHSFPIKEIGDVLVESSIFFATLKLMNKTMSRNLFSVPYLKKKEALCARNIIQGLVVADKEGIDITHIQNGELVKKIEEIGKVYTKK